MLNDLSSAIDEKMLVNILILTLDKYRGDVLLVEGRTDKLFYDKIIDDDCYCVDVGSLFQIDQDAIFEMDPFSPNPSNVRRNFNHKHMLIKMVLASLMNADILDNFGKINAKTKRRSQFFAIVDRDNESMQNIKHLFYTDTYDLETMLLSSDSQLLYHYNGKIVEEKSIERAMFLAYQITCTINSVASDIMYDDNVLYNLKWGDFIDGYDRIKLQNFIRLINATGTKVNKKIIDKIVKRKYKDGGGKYKKNESCNTEEYIWKEDIESFALNKSSDYWQRTNGHYLALAYDFVNGHIERNNKLERDVEVHWIMNYKIENFYNTELSKRLISNKLIKELEEV